MKNFIMMLLAILAVGLVNGQTNPAHFYFPDSLRSPSFEENGAQEYLLEVTGDPMLWNTDSETFKYSIRRLLDHSRESFDSVAVRLQNMDLRSIPVSREDVLIRDTLETKWLNDSTFILDTVGWSMDLILKAEQKFVYPVDFSTLAFTDSILDENGMLDSSLFTPDTVLYFSIDTAALEALEIGMYSYSDATVTPSLDQPEKRRSGRLSPDSTQIVYTDTLTFWVAGENTPFRYLNTPLQMDSLNSAIATLLAYAERRDSTLLMVNDMYGNRTPLWLTTGTNETSRFWVKNYKKDSITLWIGNPGTGEISLLLEDDIDFNRLTKEQLGHLPRELAEPLRKLAKMEELKPDPVFWEYEVANAFTFNQTHLSNWAKGGESSLTTMLDITGNATYNNTQAKTQWINTARLKFGTVIKERDLRKNNDLFEITSQFNKNKWGKFDLSASFYLKNQIAKGYNYPNDSIPVSKFLNPGSLTVGLGLDYKPFKHTSINMAPLSYKNTFVLDTANIDQTRHGISADKKTRQELGTQILITNKMSPMEDLTISNKVRLFSNYLNHPQNIDIDWEVLVDKKISWFFTIRLNLHLIYDDDVRFTVLDADDQPVLRLDGTQKKVARTQFKEFVGLSLLFKF